MKLGELKPAKGSTQKAWRRGRGHGSGNGKTSGRGHKGQKSRSGSGGKVGFEGGQMPLYRRLPKRGHSCRNTKEIVAINVQLLNVFDDGTVVDIAALKQKGLVSNPRDGVKILGNGEIKKKLTVKVNYFSQSAIDKIKSAGGSTEVVAKVKIKKAEEVAPKATAKATAKPAPKAKATPKAKAEVK